MNLKHTTNELFEKVAKFNWIWTGVTKHALYCEVQAVGSDWTFNANHVW